MRVDLTKLHLYEDRALVPPGHGSVVSLHCHTHCSKELLTFIPHYVARIPLLAPLYRSELARYQREYGKTVDYARLWWTPPLTARQVYEYETLQIESRFGLPALISITDHDDIEAGLRLQVLDASGHIPISLEWTAPHAQGFFHFGLHNLPQAEAVNVMRELTAYTAQADGRASLSELLGWLNEFPDVLIVLNHPLWDIEFIGAAAHSAALKSLLAEQGHLIHALEINGYRSWSENKAVLELANACGLPVVSGGDRHGCCANTVLNLTRAASFAEFVSEIRADKQSEVVLLPEYRESLVVRTLEAIADILRHYPHHPLGQSCWTERVFIDTGDKGVLPLAHYWPNGGPAWVRAALWCLRVAGSHQLRPALRWALAGEEVRYEG